MRNRIVRGGDVHVMWMRFVILAGLTAALTGCGGGSSGPKRESVSAPITLQGQPLGEGQVTYEPLAAGPTASTVIKDGKYRFTADDGPVVGKYRVTILEVPKRDLSKGGQRKDAPR